MKLAMAIDLLVMVSSRQAGWLAGWLLGPVASASLLIHSFVLLNQSKKKIKLTYPHNRLWRPIGL
jgi:hypothetical protein